MKDAMETKRASLKGLLGELEAGQKRMKDGEQLTQPEAEALDAKAEEATVLQQAIQAHDGRMAKVAGTIASGRTIKDPVQPMEDHGDQVEQKTEQRRRTSGEAVDGKPIVGYVTLGDYVVHQKALSQYIQGGAQRAGALLAEIPRSFLQSKRGGLVPISQAGVDLINEVKAVPTIGTSPVVIEPTLIPDLVRVTEQDALRLRDVLNIQSTNSSAVKYTRLVSYTRAASSVANSAAKPEGTLSLDAVTEAVRTIAVHMPVEEQQLSDYPALSGIINGELLYDVEKHVEELVMYGDGTGENFAGIIPDAAVLAARTVGGDSFIDISRRAVTDVRRAGYEPNAILIDPLDWEEIVLEKGTDNRYVWVVVTEGATQRLWAVPVIETVAMEDFAGVSTEARNMLVGDFLRGATLWDRERSSISVGWINNQFILNQRTILAELRAAFGVRRPGAFRKHETQAASAS